jgi:hypothetical protein
MIWIMPPEKKEEFPEGRVVSLPGSGRGLFFHLTNLFRGI